MIWNGFCLLSENQTEKQSKGRKRKLFFHSFRSHIFRHFLQCIPVSCTRHCRTMLRNKIEYLINFYENDTPIRRLQLLLPKSPTTTVAHTIEKYPVYIHLLPPARIQTSFLYLCRIQNKNEKRNPISEDSRYHRLANRHTFLYINRYRYPDKSTFTHRK